ncbi:transducin/WD40 repeat-like superfamily protein [Actinidia rufa]|uniref:Transducin/WD40 repeat-like superfamily protein n=1 Tax=Actinidia rufa TaxID=165716 RepID=A0A7J0ESC5_9ERIC|nr:transducin/WD40 repeat-like superfamily protein [Actinidia rufa]
MLRLRAFRPTNDKIVKIQLHPTHPWLVTADASDRVSVWNWEHRQVIYELKAGGVDERRLVGAKLEKLAEGESEPKGKPTEAMRGGSVKQVSFYDDDVCFWQLWRNRSAAAEAPSAVNNVTSAFSSPAPSTKGRHFLVICCENKAIFLDLVTMRGRDVPKQDLDNRSLLWQVPNILIINAYKADFVHLWSSIMEFLSTSSVGDGPLVAFGGSDGIIRVLSMITWRLVRRYTGGHKGSIYCLMNFMASSGEALLVSGGSDGLLLLWSADHGQDSRELVPKLTLKAHDGGVVAVELSRVSGGAPQLITIGADKTLAIWDTTSFKELRRIKPVPKLACHSVASWCHPRAPNLDILTCVKDSHIWAIEHPTYSALTRPLCELSSLVPPQVLASHKKLRVYCMVAHPLQPHLVATGSNLGVIVSEFDAKSLPAVAPLPTPAGSREHSAVYVIERELKLLHFQLSNIANPSLGSNSSLSETGRFKGDSIEQLHVKQIKKHIITPVPHDSYSVLSVSSSGKYLAIVWPDIPYFSIYKVSDWSIVDSGSARLLAWDTCRDRFALLESAIPPRMPIIAKGGSSRKAKEAAVAAAQAAAAAATAAASASVQVRILLDDGTSNILMRVCRSSQRTSYWFARRCSAWCCLPNIAKGFGSSGLSSFTSMDDGLSSYRSPAEASPQNFQLYSWETFQPVGGLFPQPEWTAWDQTVEYCAFAYQQYIVISSLRPQYRYLGDVAIPHATGAVWHRRQLRKEEMKLKEAQARAVVEHGELALIAVDNPQTVTQERITLRPPMLQVVRLASFQHAPSVPPFLSLPKQSKVGGDESAIPKEMEERKVNEVAVGGGGVCLYMCAHAISLSHPGIRCRCLAAHGDAVSAVKWASRLGREHHDDLAQFMLGMGYATEALHLTGISKRLEFDLAMQSNDLKRALQCLLTMSNSRDIGQETVGLNLNDILSLTDKKENIVDAVQGVVKFAKEFLDLIDAADATAQADIAREALKRLAAAGSVKGALGGHELRGQALRLANHGELTRLSNLVNNLISVGSGREAAFAGAVLGDNALMEKAWQETGMLAEAVLHAHAHGRPSLRNLAQVWNKMLQKEKEPGPSTKTDAAAAFLASLEGPKLTSLADAAKKPPIEILPPGMASLYGPIPGQKKPGPITPGVPQQPGKPMLLEAPPAAAPPATTSPPPSESIPAESGAPASSEANPPGPPVPSDSGSTPGPTESSAPTTDNQAPTSPLAGDMSPIVPGESVPTSSASGQALTETPHPVQKIQGMTTPDTAPPPMIDFS